MRTVASGEPLRLSRGPAPPLMIQASRFRALLFRLRFLLAAVLVVPVGPVRAGPDDAAAALQARYAELGGQLQNNPFKRPIVLRSAQDEGALSGDVYAVVDHPFETLQAGLQGAQPWCDVLILHLNVKRCRAEAGAKGRTVAISVGKKVEQVLGDTHCVTFDYREPAARAAYKHVTLSADKGPLGTRDYRIDFEAVPLPGGRSFVHLRYSYSYGLAARLAMQGYFSTVASAKIGFSVIGRTPDGQPVHVGSVRGAVERNTMRYYLAVVAHLDALSAPAHDRLDRRLRGWFAATERYAPQLRETDEASYLEMKRREIRRQQAEIAGRPGAG